MGKATFAHNKEQKNITVEKIYNAPINKLWHAWTNSQMLDQWWGPEPWKAITKSLDFSKNGYWHYYMAGPKGEKQWCWVDYLNIIPEKEFTGRDSFCKETGVIDKKLPSTTWHVKFENINNKTKMIVTLSFDSTDDMDKMIKMGFEQGFTMGLEQLDNLLKA